MGLLFLRVVGHQLTRAKREAATNSVQKTVSMREKLPPVSFRETAHVIVPEVGPRGFLGLWVGRADWSLQTEKSKPR